MIALLDYGAGNIRSVEKALAAVGANVRRLDSHVGLDHAHAVVLPGVGAFDDCINALQRQRLLDAVRAWIEAGRPFLGIFQGPVVRFQPTAQEPHLKIPQIGWNQVEVAQPSCPLFEGIPSGSYFYFVHSFHPSPADPGIVAGRTTYGRPFASAVWRDNVFATQFHPEKSQANGLRLLGNFVRWAAR